MLHAEPINMSRTERVGVQGVVKGALVHVRDATSARRQELMQEELRLKDRLEASRHTLTERAEESAAMDTQVCAH